MVYMGGQFSIHCLPLSLLEAFYIRGFNNSLVRDLYYHDVRFTVSNVVYTAHQHSTSKPISDNQNHSTLHIQWALVCVSWFEHLNIDYSMSETFNMSTCT